MTLPPDPALVPPEMVRHSKLQDRHEVRVANWIEPWDHVSPLAVGIIPVPFNRVAITPNAAHLTPNAVREVFGPVVDRVPAIRLILAHAGGAGWRDASTFAHGHPSVAFDIAELLWWLGAPGAPDRAGLRGLIEDIGADRILFGSDFPWYEPAQGLIVLEALGLPAGSISAVARETACRWFGLPINEPPMTLD